MAVVLVLAGTNVYDVLRDPEPCVVRPRGRGQPGGREALLPCPDSLEPPTVEPLDAGSSRFLGTSVAGDVRDILLGEERREKDKRSPSAQTGMRNVQKSVDDLTAQGTPPSATESAFVGGDARPHPPAGRRLCRDHGRRSGKGVEAASVSAAVKDGAGAYSWEGSARAYGALINEFLRLLAHRDLCDALVGIVDLAASTRSRTARRGIPPAVVRAATRR